MKKLILFFAVLVVLLASCKSKELIRYVEVPTIKVKIDSVIVHRTDSIVSFQRGDTVYVEKYKTLFRDRFRIKIDSISIPVEVIKEKPVEVIKEKPVLGFFWWTGVLSILLAGIWAVWKIRKMLPG
jgi:hypothetical protein